MYIFIELYISIYMEKEKKILVNFQNIFKEINQHYSDNFPELTDSTDDKKIHLAFSKSVEIILLPYFKNVILPETASRDSIDEMDLEHFIELLIDKSTIPKIQHVLDKFLIPLCIHCKFQNNNILGNLIMKYKSNSIIVDLILKHTRVKKFQQLFPELKSWEINSIYLSNEDYPTPKLLRMIADFIETI